MFVPLHDDTPLRVIRFQYVTGFLLAANLAVFLVTGAFTPEAFFAAIAAGYGVVPAEITAGDIYGYSPVPEPVTLVSYMFLHAGWLHLITNMLFLWVFADNVEDAFGHVGFLLFYVICGVAAALSHLFLQPFSKVPLVGASGAVSGVLGAYLVLYPRARIWILVLMRLPLRISAFWVIGSWFLLQLISAFWVTGEENEVAWWAHIGGFVIGVVLTVTLRSRLFVRA